MVGLNKFADKERRKARRSFQSDHIKADLRQPKYKQRVIERKRIEDEGGNYYFQDRYYDDEENSGMRG